MDAVIAAQLGAVLSRLVDGALGEAGKDAWDTLVRLIRPASRSDARPQEVLPGEAMAELEARPGDAARAEVAGRALERLAAADPEFAVLLRDWWGRTDRLVRELDSGGTNVIRGDVHGPVVQARDVHGSISFGEGRSSG